MEPRGEPENRKLKKAIISRIREKGRIPFREFMHLCLYHPVYGYYCSKREIGKGGDYYTSPWVHPIFGQLIAKQIYQMWVLMGEKAGFRIVEFGSGKGLLCYDILSYLRTEAPGFFENLSYQMVETSPFFRREGENLLSKNGFGEKVQWVIPREVDSENFRVQGCILSNELIDSFPVHLVTLQDGHLREIFVTHRGGQFREEIGEVSSVELEDYFEELGVVLDEGQRAEVNLMALNWMEMVGRILTEGFVITIDYGHEAEILYSTLRRNGTLLCYYRHTWSDNPYERIGLQDITSHVDFTSLMNRGEAMGLRNVGFTTQYRFLIGLGLLKEGQRFMGENRTSLEWIKNRLAIKTLILPDGGMGDVFKVLIQEKGLDNPQLDGLRDMETC
ncbi:MAG: SAM-dependent methyltransferase [Proteobacteria bacterium]|nr:SAM-dependent methyltransferase [Pseudomonadota bacterium]